MKQKMLIAVVCLCVARGFSSDSSEKGVPTSALKIYSGGLSAGGCVAMTDSLENYSEAFGKFSFVNTFYFRDHVSFFLDFNWFAPDANFGTDMGVDFSLFKGDIKPFIGGGIGVHYFDKSDDFGDNIGPSAVVHAGVAFDLTDVVQVRVMAPYHIILNTTRDQLAGVQIALLFSSPFKNVKKLEYNN